MSEREQQQGHVEAPGDHHEDTNVTDRYVANAVTEGQGAASIPSGLGQAAIPSATFTIKPPEPFDFSKPHEWEKWICASRDSGWQVT